MDTLTLKQKLIAGYFGIGLLVAIGFFLFASHPPVGFAASIGKGLVWPAVLIPGVGKFIGAVLLIAILIGISLS